MSFLGKYNEPFNLLPEMKRCAHRGTSTRSTQRDSVIYTQFNCSCSDVPAIASSSAYYTLKYDNLGVTISKYCSQHSAEYKIGLHPSDLSLITRFAPGTPKSQNIFQSHDSRLGTFSGSHYFTNIFLWKLINILKTLASRTRSIAVPISARTTFRWYIWIMNTWDWSGA